MLCACDTFRSGAVEQLRARRDAAEMRAERLVEMQVDMPVGVRLSQVHAQSLDVPLYEKGYGRDAAGIATDGISYAQQMGYDAVLVDTAGRMQARHAEIRRGCTH